MIAGRGSLAAEHPTLSSIELREHGTSQALMWALSRPGEIKEFALRDGDQRGLETVAECLLDLEVSFFSNDPGLRESLSRTGAQVRDANEADYLFFLGLDADALGSLERASIGTLVYPDQSATIVIACAFDSGLELRLTGPGIQSESHARVDGVPEGFWSLRNRVSSYPLGWDVFLVEKTEGPSARVLGLPRTTVIGVLPTTVIGAV